MHFSVAQWAKSGLGRLIIKVYRSHKIRHTHTHTHTPTITPDRTPLNKWSASRRGRYLHNTPDKHPFPQRDSNPLPQQSRGFRSMPYITRGRYMFMY